MARRSLAAAVLLALLVALLHVSLIAPPLATRTACIGPSEACVQRAPPRSPPRLVAAAYNSTLLEAASWAATTIPLFECSDEDITRTYYYRWRLFFLHLRHDREYGFTLSEFLPHVGWAGPFGTINCPFNHQVHQYTPCRIMMSTCH